MKKAAKKGAPPLAATAQAVAAKKTVPKDARAKKNVAWKGVSKKAVVRQDAQPPSPSPAGAEARVLDRLYAVVMDRRTADPARSHSARLLSRGPAKVAQKFGEEAVECLIEAIARNRPALIAESADVLYHLVVMWVASGVTPDQVWAELHRREGISGVVEKASRLDPLIGTSKIP